MPESPPCLTCRRKLCSITRTGLQKSCDMDTKQRGGRGEGRGFQSHCVTDLLCALGYSASVQALQA